MQTHHNIPDAAEDPAILKTSYKYDQEYYNYSLPVPLAAPELDTPDRISACMKCTYIISQSEN